MLTTSLQPRTLLTLVGTRTDPPGPCRGLGMLNGAAPSSTACPHPAVEEPTTEVVALSPCPFSSAEGRHCGTSPVIHSREHPCDPMATVGLGCAGQRAGAGTLNTGPAYTWLRARSKPRHHDGHGASAQRGHPTIRTLWHSSP